ncbi:hypothetical protein Sfum_1194 [Syntrophobacter fumaroxidans MPOB]|uniref:Uncharacterized protein n=1 Tax=Syntrophobacter fumaroxidans (strain DSM 10017 / MPOB) TaxID=335543 RepID=A0LHI5_SYNFM|nr:hypothetical protein Sfum_1194 [Syntrophobacter fumaroxidans MPOB]
MRIETSSTVQSIDGDRLHFLRTTEDPPTADTLSGIDTFVHAPGARSFADRKILVFRRRCGELFLSKSKALSRHHANEPGKAFLSFPASFCRHIRVRYVPSRVQNENTSYLPIVINLRLI